MSRSSRFTSGQGEFHSLEQFITGGRMATKNVQYNLIKGPSTFDMVKSLTDSNYNSTRPLDFEVVSFYDSTEKLVMPLGRSFKVYFKVAGMIKEDGSGESWIFYGYCNSADYPTENIEGYYSARSRTGYLKFVDSFSCFPSHSVTKES